MPGAADRGAFIGVDFSGARDAGRRIWIAEGRATAAGLAIADCRRAADLPGSRPERDTALAALGDFIAASGEAVIGLDFPFSLPEAMIEEDDWAAFVRGFAARYPDPQAFRASCRAHAPGRELKRRCDKAAKTPFSPYNLRVYRQTWHGIAELLAPMLACDAARVAPIQQAAPGRPVLLEACPASLLKAEGLYRPYKRSGTSGRDARRAIAYAVAERERGLILRLPGAVADKVIGDSGGDAMDAVLCAAAAYRAARDGGVFGRPDAVAKLECVVVY